MLKILGLKKKKPLQEATAPAPPEPREVGDEEDQAHVARLDILLSSYHQTQNNPQAAHSKLFHILGLGAAFLRPGQADNPEILTFIGASALRLTTVLRGSGRLADRSEELVGILDPDRAPSESNALGCSLLALLQSICINDSRAEALNGSHLTSTVVQIIQVLSELSPQQLRAGETKDASQTVEKESISEPETYFMKVCRVLDVLSSFMAVLGKFPSTALELVRSNALLIFFKMVVARSDDLAMREIQEEMGTTHLLVSTKAKVFNNNKVIEYVHRTGAMSHLLEVLVRHKEYAPAYVMTVLGITIQLLHASASVSNPLLFMCFKEKNGYGILVDLAVWLKSLPAIGKSSKDEKASGHLEKLFILMSDLVHIYYEELPVRTGKKNSGHDSTLRIRNLQAVAALLALFDRLPVPSIQLEVLNRMLMIISGHPDNFGLVEELQPLVKFIRLLPTVDLDVKVLILRLLEYVVTFVGSVPLAELTEFTLLLQPRRLLGGPAPTPRRSADTAPFNPTFTSVMKGMLLTPKKQPNTAVELSFSPTTTNVLAGMSSFPSASNLSSTPTTSPQLSSRSLAIPGESLLDTQQISPRPSMPARTPPPPPGPALRKSSHSPPSRPPPPPPKQRSALDLEIEEDPSIDPPGSASISVASNSPSNLYPDKFSVRLVLERIHQYVRFDAQYRQVLRDSGMLGFLIQHVKDMVEYLQISGQLGPVVQDAGIEVRQRTTNSKTPVPSVSLTPILLDLISFKMALRALGILLEHAPMNLRIFRELGGSTALCALLSSDRHRNASLRVLCSAYDQQTFSDLMDVLQTAKNAPEVQADVLKYLNFMLRATKKGRDMWMDLNGYEVILSVLSSLDCKFFAANGWNLRFWRVLDGLCSTIRLVISEHPKNRLYIWRDKAWRTMACAVQATGVLSTALGPLVLQRFFDIATEVDNSSLDGRVLEEPIPPPLTEIFSGESSRTAGTKSTGQLLLQEREEEARLAELLSREDQAYMLQYEQKTDIRKSENKMPWLLHPTKEFPKAPGSGTCPPLVTNIDALFVVLRLVSFCDMKTQVRVLHSFALLLQLSRDAYITRTADQLSEVLHYFLRKCHKFLQSDKPSGEYLCANKSYCSDMSQGHVREVARVIVEHMAAHRATAWTLKRLMKVMPADFPNSLLRMSIAGRNQCSYLELEMKSKGFAYVEMPSLASNTMLLSDKKEGQSNSGFTFSSWIHIRGKSGSNPIHLLELDSASGVHCWSAVIRNGELTVTVGPSEDDNAKKKGQNAAAFDLYRIEDNRWYNLVLILLRPSNAKNAKDLACNLYVDGKQIQTVRLASSLPLSDMNPSSMRATMGTSPHLGAVSDLVWWLGPVYLFLCVLPLSDIQLIYSRGENYRGTFEKETRATQPVMPDRNRRGTAGSSYDNLGTQQEREKPATDLQQQRCLSVDKEMIVFSLHSHIKCTLADLHAAQLSVGILESADTRIPLYPDSVELSLTSAMVRSVIDLVEIQDAVVVLPNSSAPPSLLATPVGYALGGASAIRTTNVADSIRMLGGVVCLFPLIKHASTSSELELAILLLSVLVYRNENNLKDMVRRQGYAMVGNILREKTALLSEDIAHILFALVEGRNPTSSKLHPEHALQREKDRMMFLYVEKDGKVEVIKGKVGSSRSYNFAIVANNLALQHLLLDYHIWRQAPARLQGLIFHYLSDLCNLGPLLDRKAGSWARYVPPREIGRSGKPISNRKFKRYKAPNRQELFGEDVKPEALYEKQSWNVARFKHLDVWNIVLSTLIDPLLPSEVVPAITSFCRQLIVDEFLPEELESIASCLVLGLGLPDRPHNTQSGKSATEANNDPSVIPARAENYRAGYLLRSTAEEGITPPAVQLASSIISIFADVVKNKDDGTSTLCQANLIAKTLDLEWFCLFFWEDTHPELVSSLFNLLVALFQSHTQFKTIFLLPQSVTTDSKPDPAVNPFGFIGFNMLFETLPFTHPTFEVYRKILCLMAGRNLLPSDLEGLLRSKNLSSEMASESQPQLGSREALWILLNIMLETARYISEQTFPGQGQAPKMSQPTLLLLCANAQKSTIMVCKFLWAFCLHFEELLEEMLQPAYLNSFCSTILLFHTRFHKNEEMPLLRFRTTDQDTDDARDENTPSPCVVIKPPAAFHPRSEPLSDESPQTPILRPSHTTGNLHAKQTSLPSLTLTQGFSSSILATPLSPTFSSSSCSSSSFASPSSPCSSSCPSSPSSSSSSSLAGLSFSMYTASERKTVPMQIPDLIGESGVIVIEMYPSSFLPVLATPSEHVVSIVTPTTDTPVLDPADSLAASELRQSKIDAEQENATRGASFWSAEATALMQDQCDTVVHYLSDVLSKVMCHAVIHSLDFVPETHRATRILDIFPGPATRHQIMSFQVKIVSGVLGYLDPLFDGERTHRNPRILFNVASFFVYLVDKIQGGQLAVARLKNQHISLYSIFLFGIKVLRTSVEHSSYAAARNNTPHKKSGNKLPSFLVRFRGRAQGDAVKDLQTLCANGRKALLRLLSIMMSNSSGARDEEMLFIGASVRYCQLLFVEPIDQVLIWRFCQHLFGLIRHPDTSLRHASYQLWEALLRMQFDACQKFLKCNPLDLLTGGFGLLLEAREKDPTYREFEAWVDVSHGMIRSVFEYTVEQAREFRKVQEAEDRLHVRVEEVAYLKMSNTGKSHQQALNAMLVAHKRLAKDRVANASLILKRERERQARVRRESYYLVDKIKNDYSALYRTLQRQSFTFQSLGVSFPPPGTTRWRLDLTEGVHRQRKRMERFDDFYSVYNIDLPTVANMVAQNAKEVRLVEKENGLVEEKETRSAEKKVPVSPREIRSEPEEEENSDEEKEGVVLYDPTKDSDDEAADSKREESRNKREESKSERKKSELEEENDADDDIAAIGDVSDDEKEKADEPQKKKLTESKHSQLRLRMQKMATRRGTQLRLAGEAIHEQHYEKKEEEEMVEDDGDEEDDDRIDDWDRIHRMLSPGHTITDLYSCARISGLDNVRVLVILCQSALYVINNYRIENAELVAVYESPDSQMMDHPNFHVRLERRDENSSDLVFKVEKAKDHIEAGKEKSKQELHSCQQWAYCNVRELHKRRYQLQNVGIELFHRNGSNFLIVFDTQEERDNVYNKLMTVTGVTEGMAVHLVSSDQNLLTANPLQESSVTLLKRWRDEGQRRWLKGEMSNFAYLMFLNTLAGRSYNDLTQYPVFPWVLQDYTSKELDLSDEKVFRDLSKPMGALNPERAANFQNRFNSWEDPSEKNIPKFHYGTHYSSAASVLYYLLRLEPFTRIALQLQGGRFDHADRLYHDIQNTWNSASAAGGLSDVKELIPEFFYLPEFLENTNHFDMGAQQKGGFVNDVTLPPWANGDPRVFIRLHRRALESAYVSANLHKWIDLIFGQKQRGKPAEEAMNVFYYLTYEGVVDINAIKDSVEKLATIAQINNFGQTPTQLFKKPHPPRTKIFPPVTLASHIHMVRPQSDKMVRMPRGVADMCFWRDKLMVVDENKVLVPNRSKYLSWGFPDLSLRFNRLLPSPRHRHAHEIMSVHEGLHDGQITTAMVTDDGELLLTGGEDCVVNVWAMGKQDKYELIHLRSLCGHSGAITCVAVSTQYSLVVSGSSDSGVLLWDLNRLELLRRLKGLSGAVTCLQIHPTIGDVVACAKQNICVWNLNAELIAQHSVSDSALDYIHSVALCTGPEWAGEDVIVTGHRDGCVRFFKLDLRDERDKVSKKSLHYSSKEWRINTFRSREGKDPDAAFHTSDDDDDDISDPVPCKPYLFLKLVDTRDGVHSSPVSCIYTPGSSHAWGGGSQSDKSGKKLGWKKLWTGDLSGVVVPWTLHTEHHWLKDTDGRCMGCGEKFTTFARRHHCRSCGKVFCGACSGRKAPVSQFGYKKPVRVCVACANSIVRESIAAQKKDGRKDKSATKAEKAGYTKTERMGFTPGK